MPCLMSAATALLTLAHACCGYHGEPSAATTFHRTRMPPGSPATSSRSSAASTRRRTPPLPSTSHPRLLLRRAVQIKLRAGAADLICTSNSICHRHREQHRSTSAAAWVVATNCLPSSTNRPGHECAYLCPIASR
jgi:hypothetical protein